IATYHLLEPETRDVYDGFAAGVNRYIELHAEEFPEGMPSDFSGYDVATLHIGNGPPAARIRRFVAALAGGDPSPMEPRSSQVQMEPRVFRPGGQMEPRSSQVQMEPRVFRPGGQMEPRSSQAQM